jgi:hypothetical protein
VTAPTPNPAPAHRGPGASLARAGGSEPCSYALDAEVNWLPGSLPVDFPLGATGLCFSRREAGWYEERVVLPNGLGFSLT